MKKKTYLNYKYYKILKFYKIMMSVSTYVKSRRRKVHHHKCVWSLIKLVHIWHLLQSCRVLYHMTRPHSYKQKRSDDKLLVTFSYLSYSAVFTRNGKNCIIGAINFCFNANCKIIDQCQNNLGIYLKKKRTFLWNSLNNLS